MTDSPLNALAGRWVTTITMLHPPELKGQVFHAIDAYRFLEGGTVMVHEVWSRMGDGAINSVEIYTPTDDGRFASRSFDGSGEVTDYTAEMKDGVWRIFGETQRHETSRLERDVIEGLWRLREGDDWVDWMTVRLDRVS